MHALRNVLGDSIFFPTLYQLATDSAYTYYNAVTSAEVEQLFSKAAGKNLQPLFAFYLRTTDVLQFSIKNTKYQTYRLQLLNLDMPLPVDVTTDKGTQKVMLTREGITIQSSIPPTLDGKGYYLKKIQFE